MSLSSLSSSEAPNVCEQPPRLKLARVEPNDFAYTL